MIPRDVYVCCVCGLGGKSAKEGVRGEGGEDEEQGDDDDEEGEGDKDQGGGGEGPRTGTGRGTGSKSGGLEMVTPQKKVGR